MRKLENPYSFPVKAVVSWLLFALAVSVLLFLIFSGSSSSQQTNNVIDPCPDTKPCIKLVQADGTMYMLNDFKFAAGHCLVFVSLPDYVQRKTCGNYHMDWVQPMSQNIKTGDKPVERVYNS